MDIVTEFGKLAFVVFLGLTGAVGMLALVSPSVFATVATYGNRTICNGAETRFDKHWFSFDQLVIAHGRLFGLILITSTGYVWLISRYGPEAYPRSFLLIIVAVAMVMGVAALYQIMRQSQEIASHRAEANSDPLTGLANRRVFDVELSRRLAQRHRQGTPLCLAIIDIDTFKSFNDEYGHLLGDAILKKIATTLEETVRIMDIVARIGGDEFAVLFSGSTVEEASSGSERIRSAIDEVPLQFDGRDHRMTVSVGLAEAQADDDSKSLMKRADSALYAAKEAGRNCAFRHGSPEPATVIPC